MPEEEPIEQTQYHKPNFDGRLGFHQVIKTHLNIIANSMLNHNYIGWYDALNSTYTLVYPYMRDSKEYENELIAIENSLAVASNIKEDGLKSQAYHIINRQLAKATRNLYDKAKDLLLQTATSEQEEEFDIQRFLRESDM